MDAIFADGYWIPNKNEIRPTRKVGFDKIGFSRLGT
jgi:hypothetical protein